MSLPSYRRNVRRGVTGPHFDTCLPSSLEIVSDEHELPPDIYPAYASYVTNQEHPDIKTKKGLKIYESVLDDIFWELGELSCRDVKFNAIGPDDFAAFADLIHRYLEDSYGIVVLLGIGVPGYNHAVGLIHVEADLFRIKSNQVPANLRGIRSLNEIYGHLDPKDPDPNWPAFVCTNVIGLPPAN